MPQDFDIADAEVRTFTSLVDALPDNTTSQIGANDLRAIVKSLIGRYFYMSTQNFPAAGIGLPWVGTADTPVTFTDAVDFKMTTNGFALNADGDIVYTGRVPMKVDLNVLVSFACSLTSVVRLTLTHSNPFERVTEPIVSLDCAVVASNNLVYKGNSSFTISAGSKIVISRTLVSGTVDGTTDILRMVQFSIGINASLLTPATSEVRRGVYGAQAAAGVLFSALPFTSLHRVTTFASPPLLANGQYGYDTPLVVAPSSMVAASTNNLLLTSSGSWVRTARLHFTTLPGPDSQSPGRDVAIGVNGDYLAYGSPTDTQVLVYGPMAANTWPVFGRSIPVLPPVS